MGSTVALILIWTYSFIVTSPPLFGWGEYVNEAADIRWVLFHFHFLIILCTDLHGKNSFNSCSINWETQTPNATSYIIFLFIFGLIGPMSVIIYSYTQISITLRKTKRSAKLSSQVERAERKVNAMIVLMVTGEEKSLHSL